MVDINNPEIDRVYESVLNDKDDIDWAIFYVNKDSKLDVHSSGTGGMHECIKHLENDMVQFAVFRVIGVDERGSVTSLRSKFIFVIWMGPELPAMKKARMSIQIGPVSSHFSGYHIQFQTSDLKDINEEEIIKRLRQCGGAHQPTSYDFKKKGDGEASVEKPKEESPQLSTTPTSSSSSVPPPPPPPAKPVEDTSSEGASQSLPPPSPPSPPPALPSKPQETNEQQQQQQQQTTTEATVNKEEEESTNTTQSDPSLLKFTEELKKDNNNNSTASINSTNSNNISPITPSSFKDTVLSSGDIVEACVIETWSKILDDNSPINCMLCCDKNNDKRYTVLYSGNDGLNEFKSKLDDNYVIFGGFKVLGIDKRGSVVSTRSKFIFVTWVGNKVKLMVKAKVGMIKSEVHDIFRGTHIEFYCTQLDDLNEEEIVKKLRSSGGAHQPTEYTFELGKEITA